MKIDKIAKQDNLNVSQDEKIIRIEYEYLPINNQELESYYLTDEINGFSSEFVLAAKEGDTRIVNVVSYAGEWYNRGVDRIFSAYVDGPDTFKYGESHKYSSYFTSAIGYKSKIEAAVGWKMGVDVTKYWESNTPVKSNERLHIEVFRLYNKKSYDIQMYRLGYWTYFSSGWAYRPSSLYIKKTFYSK